MEPPASPAITNAATLAGLVTRLRRALRSAVRSEIPWERLPMAQVELLQRLHDEPGLRLGELAARQHLAVNTVSNVVQQMVESRLVERHPDPADRRASVIQVTSTGLRALAEWQATNSRRIESALMAIDPDERHALIQALPALRRFVEALEDQGSGTTPRASGASGATDAHE